MIRMKSALLCGLLAALALLTAYAPRGGVASDTEMAQPGAETQTATPAARPYAHSHQETNTGSLPQGLTTLRGSLSNQRTIEMELRRAGNQLSGSYAYDGIGQRLALDGQIDAEGNLTLTERDPRGARTGRFVGRVEANNSDEEPNLRIEGKWSRPDGSGELEFWLREQRIEFANNLRVTNRVIENRRYAVRAVYPQLVGGDASVASGVRAFNQQISDRVSRAVREYLADPGEPGRRSYSTNYEVLLARGNLISVWMTHDWCCGAYPDWQSYGVTYDLRAGRELRLEGLFRPNTSYMEAIARHSLEEINRRGRELEAEEAEEARREGQPPANDPPSSLYTLEELLNLGPPDWAMTPRGLVVYYSFPHVAAIFRRNFVPYSALRELLRPDSAAAPFLE